MRSKVAAATLTMSALGVTSACGADSGGSDEAASATGPIKTWPSNNPEEIAWGGAMVKAWNEEHPVEEVTARRDSARHEVLVGDEVHLPGPVARRGQSDSTLGVATYRVGDRYSDLGS